MTTVPEIIYKGQRIIRTTFQALVGLIPVIIAVLGAANETWPSSWITAAMVASVSAQAFLAKVMAIPAVNAWLSMNTFLGSVPKKVARDSSE